MGQVLNVEIDLELALSSLTAAVRHIEIYGLKKAATILEQTASFKGLRGKLTDCKTAMQS
ncbi:MAG: hypothetical protein QXD61_07230 [Candidatus Caldarchaeum sp.]